MAAAKRKTGGTMRIQGMTIASRLTGGCSRAVIVLVIALGFGGAAGAALLRSADAVAGSRELQDVRAIWQVVRSAAGAQGLVCGSRPGQQPPAHVRK
jgi:hypothetical protein